LVDQLAIADRLGADRLLELEHQPGADRLDDRRRAALLAVHRIGEVAVLGLVDVRHRTAAGTRRDGVAQQVALGDQHAGGARAADELVRRDEHRVLCGTVACGVAAVHLDRDVRPGGRVVPERVRAVAVQQLRDRAGVARDPGDVRRRREAADLARSVGVARQLALEVLEIDVAVGVLADHADLGDRLAPRQLVRVVLERADEHDRPLVERDLTRQAVANVEIARDPQVEDVDQLVDRAGRSRAGEDHQIVGAAADRAVDDRPGVLAERGGLPAGARALGVRVGVERHHLVAQEVLDELERAPRRGVIRIRHAPAAVRPVEHVISADDRAADGLDQACAGGVHSVNLSPPRRRSLRHVRRPRRGTATRCRWARSGSRSSSRRRRSGFAPSMRAVPPSWWMMNRGRIAARPGTPGSVLPQAHRPIDVDLGP
jgi:hypothetical protein